MTCGDVGDVAGRLEDVVCAGGDLLLSGELSERGTDRGDEPVRAEKSTADCQEPLCEPADGAARRRRASRDVPVRPVGVGSSSTEAAVKIGGVGA